MNADACVGPRFIFQLPARTGRRCASTYLSVSATTPGSGFPSRNSSDAPPPVDT
jgi:hypothetical protein